MRLALATLGSLALFFGTGSLAAAPERERGLVIVAPKAFREALTGYVRFKRAQLPTQIVDLEKILKTTAGADDPDRLKRWLYTAWRERHIGYALLVGDADVMPVRYMVLDRRTEAAFNYAFYPSDLYYADLARPDGSFDDWNAAREGYHALYYGEVHGEQHKEPPINYDRIDYRPEIGVGRWPVSSAREARLVAEKTMAYETSVARGIAAGERRAALFGVGGWVDGRDTLDRLASALPAGWTAEKRYYSDDSRKDGTPPPSGEDLRKLLNSGVGLVVHTGHGSGGSWGGCLSLDDISRLRNADRLPVMISAGCDTARFATLAPYEAYVDADGREHVGTTNGEVFTSPPPPPAAYQKGKYNVTGIGEQLIRAGMNGAVAYIGCDTGAQPCDLTLIDGFAVALSKSPHPRLGDCWAGAVSYYYDHEHLATLTPNDDWYPPSIFFQAMKFMVFGDPSLQMPSPDTEAKASSAEDARSGRGAP